MFQQVHKTDKKEGKREMNNTCDNSEKLQQ
jgi:hypothetical protein